TFVVAKHANITIDDAMGRLEQLLPGADITLSELSDATTARRVDAGGSLVEGYVKAVDGEKNTFTFDDQRANLSVRGKTIVVGQDTKISIDDRPGALTGLVGARVCVRLAVDQRKARGIVLAW